MSLAADRPEFAPPPQRGTPRAVLFALLAHALLIAALTWGVNWKREAEDDAVEAELWSTTVQRAAPRAVAPTPVPPVPTPVPAPPPPPPPPPAPPRAVVPPAPPPPKAPDIALEREKQLQAQKEEQQRQQAEQQKKLDAAKKLQQQQAEAKQRAEEEAERKAEEQKKADAAKKLQQQQQQQAEAKAAADKAAADAAKKKEADAKQAAQLAADRQATLKRMQALAGSGDQSSTGQAARSSGPSGSYGAKVAAAVRPNVVFPDADLVSGNPAAEFDVRLAPDGTIVGTPQLTKSSGLSNWDDAALRALVRTEKLPRDIDGTVPSRLIVALRPKR